MSRWAAQGLMGGCGAAVRPGLSGRGRAVDEPAEGLLPLALPLPLAPSPSPSPTPSPDQADSKLSEKLTEANFKQFLSQHEMTLVNFFAP